MYSHFRGWYNKWFSISAFPYSYEQWFPIVKTKGGMYNTFVINKELRVCDDIYYFNDDKSFETAFQKQKEHIKNFKFGKLKDPQKTLKYYEKWFELSKWPSFETWIHLLEEYNGVQDIFVKDNKCASCTEYYYLTSVINNEKIIDQEKFDRAYVIQYKKIHS
jgi:hypothetical protein